MQYKAICVHLEYGTIITSEVTNAFKELVKLYLKNGTRPAKLFDHPFECPLNIEVKEPKGAYLAMWRSNIRPYYRLAKPLDCEEFTLQLDCIDYGEI